MYEIFFLFKELKPSIRLFKKIIKLFLLLNNMFFLKNENNNTDEINIYIYIYNYT